MSTETNTTPEEPELATEPAAEAATAGPLKELKAELDRYRDLALRGQADFDNYRKRAAREKEEALRYANMGLVEKLLPILDNFELGLNAARGNEASASIVQGMDMVRRQLEEFLQQQGVEVVPCEGLLFDPNQHEAVGQEPHAEIAEGHVVRQLRKGYKLRDRLVRAALVVISSGPAA